MSKGFSFKMIFDSSPLPIYIIQDGTLKLFNQQLRFLTGYSEEELSGAPYKHLIYHEDWPLIESNYRKRLSGEEVPGRYEFRAVNAGGEVFYVSGSFSLIEYEGRPAVLGQWMDITRSKKMEEELRKSEERYRNIVDNMVEAYFEVDLAGRFTFCNPAMYSISGYDESQLGNKSYKAFMDEDNARKVFDIYNQVFANGETVRGIEFEVIRKDGSKRIVETSVSLIVSPQGRPEGFRSMYHDVTARRLAEEELRKSREMYRELFENANDMIYTHDLEGNLISVNGAVEKVLGYSPGELAALNISRIADPVYLARAVEKIRQARKEKTDRSLHEVIAYKKDGSPICLEVNNRLFRDERGKPSGIHGIARDITDRKRAEEALRESQRVMSTLMGNLPGMAYRSLNDGQWTIEFVSEGCFGLIGYRQSDLHRRGWRDYSRIFHPADREHIWSTVTEALREHRQYQLEYRMIDAGGNEKWVWERGCGVWSDQGRLVAREGFISDITDRKNAEEAQRTAYQELEAANEELEATIEELNATEEELRKSYEELRELSLHDPLTGLYNRTYFEEEMHRLESGRACPLGIIVCDVDGLKIINDTFGHKAGDSLLVSVAGLIAKSFREGDVVARIGGDEFAIILPNSNEEVVKKACERIRSSVIEYNSSYSQFPLSISIGSATTQDKAINMNETFKFADNNMYREKLHRSQSARSSIVQTLMKALEARDFITEGHAERLQNLATVLAEALGLPDRSITDLRLLAQFHDIGKVGIPDRILFKPGPLTSKEFAEMQRHSEIGHRIAQSAPDLAPIADWILKHHEWWNGKGYPLGLKGEEIALECRILAIVDAYDAMTTDRPYRKAMSHTEAVEELKRCSGVQFDPDLLAVFLRYVDSVNGL